MLEIVMCNLLDNATHITWPHNHQAYMNSTPNFLELIVCLDGGNWKEREGKGSKKPFWFYFFLREREGFGGVPHPLKSLHFKPSKLGDLEGEGIKFLITFLYSYFVLNDFFFNFYRHPMINNKSSHSHSTSKKEVYDS